MTFPTIPTHSELRAKALAAKDEGAEHERYCAGDFLGYASKDAAFIAAVTPATILSLLDQIAAYREALEVIKNGYQVNYTSKWCQRTVEAALSIPSTDRADP